MISRIQTICWRKLCWRKLCRLLPAVLFFVQLSSFAQGTNASAGQGAWCDQIVYVLIPEKFCDGDPANNFMREQYHLPNPKYHGGFLGGDLAGIHQQMAYLKNLGVTAVLLYPVLKNDRKDFLTYLPTGYRVSDYHSVDPNFGTDTELTQVINDLHDPKSGPRLNVILDLPFAMVGLEHPWYMNAAAYRDHFRKWNAAVPSENIASQPMTLAGEPVDNNYAMPILNHTNGMETQSGTYRDLRDGILFWLADHYDFDGFRYDSAQNIMPEFWRHALGDFHQRYDASRPGFFHVGEVALDRLRSWQQPPGRYLSHDGQTLMDGIYDFGVIVKIQEVFAAGADARSLVREMNNHSDVDHPERMIASVDLYEDPTFLKRVPDTHARERLRLALTFLLTINRVPFIYSGNELGMDYSLPGELFRRQAQNQTNLDFFKTLVQLRREHPAFRDGKLKWLESSPKLLCYLRQDRNGTFIVALNLDDQPQTLTLPPDAIGKNFQSAKSVLPPEEPGTLTAQGLELKLNPWGARVIRLE
jgi:glycosidase